MRSVMLDALRVLAAIAVLSSHVTFWTGNRGTAGLLMARGDVGVALFFALSAYLLWGRIARTAVLGARQDELARYGLHRVARLVPAYLLALVAVLATLGWVSTRVPGAGQASAGAIGSYLIFAQGFTPASQHFQAFTQTWSLTTEVTFYLTLAALLWWLARRPWMPTSTASLTRPWLVFGGLGLSIALLVPLAAQAGWSWAAGVAATSLLGHGWWFAAGGLTAAWSIAHERGWRVPTWWLTIRAHPGPSAGTALVLFALIATDLGGPRDLSIPTALTAGLKEATYGVIALLALSAATSPAWRFEERPSWAAGSARREALATAAGASYALFLWHLLVIQVTFAHTGWQIFSAPLWSTWAIVLLASLVIAVASWILVEQPILEWVRRGDGQRRAARASEIVQASEPSTPAIDPAPRAD